MHVQELEAIDSLCHSLVNEDRFMSPLHFLVNKQLLDLANVEDTIIVLAPLNQISNLSPVR